MSMTSAMSMSSRISPAVAARATNAPPALRANWQVLRSSSARRRVSVRANPSNMPGLCDIGIEPAPQGAHRVLLVEQRDTNPVDVDQSFVDDGQDQLIAGGEVPVQRAGTHAGGAGDVVERRAHTVAIERFAGGVEQQLAIARRVGAQRSRRIWGSPQPPIDKRRLCGRCAPTTSCKPRVSANTETQNLAGGPVMVAAMARTCDPQPSPQPPTLNLNPLPGDQYAATLRAAPTARPRITLPTRPLKSSEALEIPIGPTGILVGAALYDDPEANPPVRLDDLVMLSPTDPDRATRISMDTSEFYIRQLLIRAAAVGERIAIYSHQPSGGLR
jgi:hypothetical protein